MIQLRDLYDNLRNKENINMELLAGIGGLRNIVRWMHTVESDEYVCFLEGYELVVITGVALKNEGELIKLIMQLHEHKASGAIINVGHYIESIPAALIEYCNNNDFPLFIVPWEVYMAHIIKIFSEQLLKEQTQKIEFVTAMKNAVYYHERMNEYVPALENQGLHADWPYCIANIEISGKNGIDLSDKIFNKIELTIQNHLMWKVFKNSTMQFRNGNEIIILFAKIDDISCYSLLVSAIQTIPSEILDQINYYVGIGRQAKTMQCIYKSYNIAKKIIRLNKKRSAINTIDYFNNLGELKLFLPIDDFDVLEEYYKDILQPLVKFDETNNTGYIEFLKIYFDNGASVKATAEKLFMHRNSINYKLRKIEDILDGSLSDFNRRMRITIALQIRDLLK